MGSSPPSSLGRMLSRGETHPSKSGGNLHVMLQLNRRDLKGFLGTSKALRIYIVNNIPKGGVGANEFHRLRSEVITAENGAFMLFLEDLYGRRKSVNLRERATYGVIRPFTLHTYVALTDDAALHIVANTLYHHRQPRTHDTYPESEFRTLQRRLR
jgi:hypothetical protein